MITVCCWMLIIKYRSVSLTSNIIRLQVSGYVCHNESINAKNCIFTSFIVRFHLFVYWLTDFNTF